MEYYPLMDEQELCGVAVSTDIFHGEPIINYLRGLSFYDSSKEHKANEYDDFWVMKTGKAEDNGIGYENRLNHRSTTLYTDFYNDGSMDIDQMYINTEGWILADCDYSYEEQKK